jgi:tRNA threonylcarbamoyladenosine biosynthesis protein TsaB
MLVEQAARVRILAIETASPGGSVALLAGDQLAGRIALDPAVGSARTLAPAIQRLLNDAGIRAEELKLIAVCTGPGSFTGLRIGITTAKTLAYALGCQVLGVDTLDAIAAQVPRPDDGEHSGELHAVIDAQRRELFVGKFGLIPEAAAAASAWRRRGETEVLAAEQWLSQLAPGTIVTGPGLNRLADRLPPQVVVMPQEHWAPDAATVGRLAYTAWQAGRRDDLFKLAPTYIRPSYADEKAK